MRSPHEFTETYKEHYRPILAYINARVGDTEVAEDLAGEVFYKAWRGRGRFRVGTSSKAWLFRIARNTLIDYWRRKKTLTLDNTQQDQIISQALSIEDTAELNDEIWRLARALDQLTGTMKSVVILRFIEGMPAKEVAKLLNITEGNVRTIQFRALAKLREFLQ